MLAAALLGGGAAYVVASADVSVQPGDRAWRRLVRGAAPDGRVSGRAVVDLPGAEREPPALVRVAASAAALLASVDGGPPVPVALGGGAALLPLPASRSRGARLTLAAADGRPWHLTRVSVERRTRPWARTAAAALCAASIAACALAAAPSVAPALALLGAGLAAAAATPAAVLLALPAWPAATRVVPVLLLLGGAVSLGLSRRADRGAFGAGALLASAFVLGAWARVFFLFSAGSWDMEYWKAWSLRGATAGLARVYGDPDAVPHGHFWAQMRGEEPLWMPEAFGRRFFIDYPPLAMLMWRWSWLAVTRLPLDAAEAQNAAVKLPALLGDVAAVAVLAWAMRDRPRRAAAMAALYWGLPVSWLSSAVLGFLDGAGAPLALAALVTAGRGRAGATGVLLALAGLVKPTFLVVGPAAALALHARAASLGRATAAGLLTVAASLLPFVLAGTLATAVVHVYRILFQGTLSGGYPNPWWLLGHALAVKGGAALAGPVAFLRIEGWTVPVRPIGSLLFVLLALAIGRAQWRRAGVGPAALAGAALVWAYGLTGIGVHENHPHPMFLLLAATALGTPLLAGTAAVSALVYVANMLAMSGLGRFYGTRYLALEPLAEAAQRFRMAAGFDVTLALAVVNVLAFAVLLARLRAPMDGLAEAD